MAGKLNRVAMILPAARHFAGRIYHHATRENGNKKSPLYREVIEDLKLWITIIKRSEIGLSINTLVRWKVKVEARTDASEHGLGGYTSQDLYWRLELPSHLRVVFTLNLLEFLTSTFIIIMILRSNSRYTCV